MTNLPSRARARPAPSAKATSAVDVALAVDTFIDKFEPAIARCIRACRVELRRQLPGAFELVYDNYNFFVVGFSATARPSDCIVSLAASANGVALSFYRGADVPDPKGLLQGEGKQNRFVRLPTVEALRLPEVQALIHVATGLAPHALGQGQPETIVRSVSARQRPRRRIAPDE